jgi:hypothetical protein
VASLLRWGSAVEDMASREVDAPDNACNRIAAALHRREAATIGAIVVQVVRGGGEQLQLERGLPSCPISWISLPPSLGQQEGSRATLLVLALFFSGLVKVDSRFARYDS